MQYLEREYSRAEASLVIVYGRRRVGKTELINAFCKTAATVSWGSNDRNELFILFSVNGFSPALREIAEKDKSVILSERP